MCLIASKLAIDFSANALSWQDSLEIAPSVFWQDTLLMQGMVFMWFNTQKVEWLRYDCAWQLERWLRITHFYQSQDMALLKFQMVNSADPCQDNQSYNM